MPTCPIPKKQMSTLACNCDLQQWHAIINRSPTLQRALFFAARPTSSNPQLEPTELNPLLTKIIGSFEQPGGSATRAIRLPHLFRLNRDPRLLRPNASAWRMLLCQPPQCLRSAIAAIAEQQTHVSTQSTNFNFDSANYNGQSLREFFQATDVNVESAGLPYDSEWPAWYFEIADNPRKLKIAQWRIARWEYLV